MGLPGSGKTTLASALKASLEKRVSVEWLNADIVRAKHDDWDFSEAGRIRQSQRMHDLCDQSSSDIVICDFVAPLERMRAIFRADYLVWMNTIRQGRFENTNAIFEAPELADRVVTKWDSQASVTSILTDLAGRGWFDKV